MRDKGDSIDWILHWLNSLDFNLLNIMEFVNFYCLDQIKNFARLTFEFKESSFWATNYFVIVIV